MVPPRRSARRLAAVVATAVALAAVQGAGCQDSGAGGITVAATDESSPNLSLGVAEEGASASATVGTTGNDATVTVAAKTSKLTLVATATDNESGVQDVQIWVIDPRTELCDAAGVCSGGAPGLTTGVRFDAPTPQVAPGGTTSASTILGQSLDLSQELDQAAPPAGHTRTTSFAVYAVAVNHLGGRAVTKRVTVTFSEIG
jgi:hypothetical protein